MHHCACSLARTLTGSNDWLYLRLAMIATRAAARRRRHASLCCRSTLSVTSPNSTLPPESACPSARSLAGEGCLFASWRSSPSSSGARRAASLSPRPLTPRGSEVRGKATSATSARSARRLSARIPWATSTLRRRLGAVVPPLRARLRLLRRRLRLSLRLRRPCPCSPSASLGSSRC